MGRREGRKGGGRVSNKGCCSVRYIRMCRECASGAGCMIKRSGLCQGEGRGEGGGGLGGEGLTWVLLQLCFQALNEAHAICC